MNRLAMALSMPGIDSSCWLTLGSVDDDHDAFTWVPGTGWLVDVTFHGGKLDQVPSVPCRVASGFASSNEVSSCPLNAGDEVLVAMPGLGDPNMSPVVIARLTNQGSSPVPQFIFTVPVPELIDEIFARATHFLVTTKDVKAQVGNEFRVDAQASAGLHAPLVTLADPVATQAFVRGTDFAAALNTFLAATNVAAGALAGLPGMAGPMATWQAAITNMITALAPGVALSVKIRGE